MSGYSQDDEEAIRSILLGRTVAKVGDDKLRLDDGTELTITPNEGWCSCGAGDYALTELNECPVNAIMAVEFERIDDTSEWATSYRVFVLAEDRRIKLMQVDGDDGNGYYGTGYWINVTTPTATP